jgi:hypothetical protein
MWVIRVDSPPWAVLRLWNIDDGFNWKGYYYAVRSKPGNRKVPEIEGPLCFGGLLKNEKKDHPTAKAAT